MGSSNNKAGFNLLFVGWIWPVNHGNNRSVLADFHSLPLLFSKVKARLTLCLFQAWPMEFESLLLRKINLVCCLLPLFLTPSRIDVYLCFLLADVEVVFPVTSLDIHSKKSSAQTTYSNL